SVCLITSSTRVGALRVTCDYNVTAFATVDSQTTLFARSTFFAWSPADCVELQSSINQQIRLGKCIPEVLAFQKTLSCDPFAAQLDTTIVTNLESKSLESISGITSNKNVPGVSVKLSIQNSSFALDSAVGVVASSSTSEYMHIDSISYRLLRYLELKPSLIGSACDNDEPVAVCDVLFGVIRPAVTGDIYSDRVVLPLPFSSIADCIWTTDNAYFSCRYDVEVSIATSLDPIVTTTDANVECPPIILKLPVSLVPPTTFDEAPLPAWTSLCLVALADDDLDWPSFSALHEFVGVQNAIFAPCQTVKIPGGLRGPAGLNPTFVRDSPVALLLFEPADFLFDRVAVVSSVVRPYQLPIYQGDFDEAIGPTPASPLTPTSKCNKASITYLVERLRLRYQP
ncbi:unnamed protein product, partial [Mesocestoides corti]